MKTKKLLAKIRDLLSTERRELAHKSQALSEVLDKLARKEASLTRKLAETDDVERRAALERKLAVMQAQRTKGLLVLEELSEASGATDPSDRD